MAGLIFFVARAGVVDVGEAIEGEFAVAFEAFGGGAAVDFFVVFVAGVDVHWIDQAAAAGDLLKSAEEEPAVEAVFEGLMKIANGAELFFYVALIDFLGEGAECFCGGVAGFQGLRKWFRRRACRSSSPCECL